MGQVATVRVVHPTSESGFMIINESDFDASAHVRWTPPASTPVQAIAPAPVVEPSQTPKPRRRR